MIAEVYRPDGFFVGYYEGEPLTEHVYCDSCGDCIICSPHDETDYCPTGGRWVLYTDKDEEQIAAMKNQEEEEELPHAKDQD